MSKTSKRFTAQPKAEVVRQNVSDLADDELGPIQLDTVITVRGQADEHCPAMLAW